MTPLSVFAAIPGSHSDDNTTLKDSDDAPIHIVSDKIEGTSEDTLIYSGNVIITQGDRVFKTDKAIYYKKTNDVEAKGNITFEDAEISGTSTYLKANMENDTAEIHETTYQFTCQEGRGEAYRVYKDGKRIYRLEDGTFTTCPVDNNVWKFSATEIVRDESTPYVDFYNPKLDILGVPVFYFPWIRLPATEERLTGFLFPTMSYDSDSGFDIIQPFYWNIDPQYDMTITTRYMEERGTFFRDKFRYLTDIGSGSITGEYMGNDRYYTDDDDKWGINWSHTTTYGHWKLDVDYSKVSMNDYFSHVTSDVGTRSDSQLLQTGTISYRDSSWDASVTARDFQILSTSSYSYRMMPQVEFNYYSPYNKNNAVQVNVTGNVTRFDTDDPDKPDADRLYVSPAINYPITESWWNMDTEVKLHYAYYNQTNFEDSSDTNVVNNLDEHPSYTIPSYRWKLGVNMERDAYVGDTYYLQTLEPKIQYLYIPEVDQSDIFNPVDYSSSNTGSTVTGGYDTALLKTDYIGMFRDTKYSGSDYIASANQLTIGVSTRFLDKNYQERFNASAGQIFYFQRETDSEGDRIEHSAWAAESDFNIADTFLFHTSMQYNSYVGNFQFASAAAELRDPGNDEQFFQLSYRYISDEYLELVAESYSTSLTEDGISQAGALTGFNLTDDLNITGGYYIDTKENLLYEEYITATYKFDCWALAFAWNRYLMTRSSVSEEEEYENKFSFAFYLLGIGGSNLTNFGKLSVETSLDYRNSFYLDN